jgi:hypothetical protein
MNNELFFIFFIIFIELDLIIRENIFLRIYFIYTLFYMNYFLYFFIFYHFYRVRFDN